MKKFIPIFLFLVVIASCETRHEQEVVVRQLLEERVNLNDVLENYESTRYYKDSILKDTNPNTLWLEHFVKFDNYSIEPRGYWFDKRYYTKYKDVDNKESYVIAAINSKNEDQVLEFHFKKEKNKWQLVTINYRPAHQLLYD